MLACMQLALHTVRVKDESTQPLYMGMLMGSTATMVVQYFDSVLLSRWTYEAQGPTSALGGQTNLRKSSDVQQHGKKPRSGTVVERLVFGWEEAFRCRSARTPWEVNHVPRFFPENPDLVPSRAQFLYWTLRRCLISFLVVDVISFLGRDATSNAINFASSRISFFSRLQDVTTVELVLRLVSSVLNWVTVVYLLQALYDVTAVVVIGLGLGRIERWPPLFNSWKECWSVRNFWGYCLMQLQSSSHVAMLIVLQLLLASVCPSKVPSSSELSSLLGISNVQGYATCKVHRIDPHLYNLGNSPSIRGLCEWGPMGGSWGSKVLYHAGYWNYDRRHGSGYFPLADRAKKNAC